MRRLADMGLRALLTDPVTGQPLCAADRFSLAVGLAYAVAIIVSMIAIWLALEPVR